MLTGCISQPKIGTNEIPVKLIINYSDFSQVFETKVLENSTVFDLLKNYTQLDYTDYPGVGVFINRINNLSNSQEKFWMFYVDGNLSGVGVSAYVINKSIVIEMRYEKPSW